jgi:hypothetical protein
MEYVKTNWQLAEEALDQIVTPPMSLPARFSRWIIKHVGLPRARRRAATADAENRALSLQIRMARDFMQLRSLARKKLLAKPDWPATASMPEIPAEAPNFGVKSLLKLAAEIKNAEIPSQAKDDMLADYWNKWAFITWERALLEEDPAERREWLGYVNRYLELIEQDPERMSWTPWQMNVVRVRLAESITQPPSPPGKIRFYDNLLQAQKAQAMLACVLGKVPPETPPIPDNTAQIADMIAKMAAVPNSIAIASNLLRSYPGLSADSIRKITDLLAGRIDPALLDQIMRQYSGPQ